MGSLPIGARLSQKNVGAGSVPLAMAFHGLDHRHQDPDQLVFGFLPMLGVSVQDLG